MSRHRLQKDLELATMESPIKAIQYPSAAGVMGYGLVFKNGVATNAEAGYHPACIWVDTTNKTIKFNNGSITSTTWADIDTSSSVTLDEAFDLGKEIDGASSSANALQVGNGTDNITLYYNAANDVRISTLDNATLTILTDGTGNLALAPAGGTTAITGAVTISTTLAVTGAATFGGFSTNAIAAATSGGPLTVDGNGSGAVTIGSLSTGGIALADSTTLAASKTLTLTGVAGSNIFTITAGDVVLSDASIALTDADNAETLTVVNNTITTADLATITSTSLTTGAALKITTDGITSGAMIYLDNDQAGSFTGTYIYAYDGTAQDFAVKLHGEIEIAGNDASDMLTITKGNVQIDDGKIEIDVDSDLGSYIKRNQATTTTPIFEIEGTAASEDQVCLLLDHNGTGASSAMEIDHEGTADCLTITSLATAASAIKVTCEHATGTAYEAISAASATTGLMTLTNGGSAETGWLGATGVGMLSITNSGNLAHANASCLLITYSGTGAATGLGTSLRIVDTGATATSYAAYISAATGEALYVAVGKAKFAESVILDTGLTMTTSGATVTEAATHTYFDAGAADETFNFGNTTATDVIFHGSGAGGEDVQFDSSASALKFASGAALVLPQGTGSGGSGRQEVTGSLFYETDAKKLWVYDGAGWVGVALA